MMLDRSEILRYLGAPNTDKTLGPFIDRGEREVLRAANPKHTYQRIPLAVDAETGLVNLAGVGVTSYDLAAHLRGCKEGYLFACTLGPGIDALVKRYTFTNSAMLPVVQAVSAAYIEHCANEAQRQLEELATRQGLFLRPRYSPGYGDFSLECQRLFFNVLQIPQRLGVSLTESLLMVPSKSITAVIGLSDDPSLCHVNRCMTCTAVNCPFRKELSDNV